MDVLRVLSSPNLDIRKKTLDIAMELITARNIDEVRRRGAGSSTARHTRCTGTQQLQHAAAPARSSSSTQQLQHAAAPARSSSSTQQLQHAAPAAPPAQVVMMLKKEIVKTQNKDLEKGPEYRQMLVAAIHSCAVKFPDVAASVIHLLMDFLGDANTASALDVVFFVREIMETHAKLRPTVLERLRDTFYQIRCGGRQGRPARAAGARHRRSGAAVAAALGAAATIGALCPARRSSRVCSCALWILGEYSQDAEQIDASIDIIKQGMGPMPLLAEPTGAPPWPASPACARCRCTATSTKASWQTQGPQHARCSPVARPRLLQRTARRRLTPRPRRRCRP